MNVRIREALRLTTYWMIAGAVIAGIVTYFYDLLPRAFISDQTLVSSVNYTLDPHRKLWPFVYLLVAAFVAHQGYLRSVFARRALNGSGGKVGRLIAAVVVAGSVYSATLAVTAFDEGVRILEDAGDPRWTSLVRIDRPRSLLLEASTAGVVIVSSASLILPLIWFAYQPGTRPSAAAVGQAVTRRLAILATLPTLTTFTVEITLRVFATPYDWLKAGAPIAMILSLLVLAFIIGSCLAIRLSAIHSAWYAQHCDACGYDMTGCPRAERCPECGAGWKSDGIAAA